MNDLFGISFEDIAVIVARSPEAARQLASRARRRLRGETQVSREALARQQEVGFPGPRRRGRTFAMATGS
ncbi:MAG: hypothetical protein ACRET5_08270 [Steroidobacteraceae bacterium]